MAARSESSRRGSSRKAIFVLIKRLRQRKHGLVGRRIPRHEGREAQAIDSRQEAEEELMLLDLLAMLLLLLLNECR